MSLFLQNVFGVVKGKGGTEPLCPAHRCGEMGNAEIVLAQFMMRKIVDASERAAGGGLSSFF